MMLVAYVCFSVASLVVMMVLLLLSESAVRAVLACTYGSSYGAPAKARPLYSARRPRQKYLTVQIWRFLQLRQFSSSYGS